jgi:hypothetical protein
MGDCLSAVRSGHKILMNIMIYYVILLYICPANFHDKINNPGNV